MQLERSLTRTTQLAIVATVLPGLVALYLFTRNLALEAISTNLLHEVPAVMTPYLQDFRRIEGSVVTLADALSERFAEAPRADEPALFDAAVSRDAQGVVRNRRESFDGRRKAGVFIPPGVALTDDLKRRKWRAMRVVSGYGRAALQHVDGVWFDELDKTSVIFWRRDPDFIYTLPADHDYTQTLWDRLASPALNPGRKPQWTPAILETTVGTWVVSCVAPLDRDGQWQGVVGHDIALSDLIATFHSSDFYPGTQHFLLDLDPDKDGALNDEGSYILAGPWQAALEQKAGDFRPDLSAEPELKQLLWQPAGRPRQVGPGIRAYQTNGRLPLVPVQRTEYLAIVVDLEPLNWRFVELVPVNAVLAPVYKANALLAALMVLTVLTVVLFMRSSLRQQVVEPLARVMATVRAWGSGRLDARTQLREGDEIAQLGRAFDVMADNVADMVQALQASESRYRSVVENIHETVFQCDPQLRIQFLSPAWQTLAGRPPVGCVGHLLTEYLHPEDVERHRADVREMREGRAAACSGTYRLLRANGEVRWVELSLRPVAHADHGTICIGSIDDITERLQAQKNMLRLQEQLRQAQKMEALGRLTGGVAHDYNNILAIMLGYTELAMERDGALKPMLERVLQAGERGRDLVAKMLTFSRRKVGVPVPSNAAALIDETVTMLRATIPANIVLTTDIAPDVGPVLVDPTGFCQMVMNLVINSRDAMPEGGHVAVRLRPASDCRGVCSACHGDVAGSFVAVEVDDDGSGIPEGLLPSIFDPFFTTKDVGRGTGMGLSVVHGIIHESHGHVIVDSRPGAGTTVRLLLPPAPAAATVETPVSPLPAPPGPGRAARVLVVDDEPELVKLWERALTRHGYEVEAFTDSTRAIERFRADPGRYEVVILDQAMPGLTGEAMAREMLAMRAELPIVLCTGYSETIDAAGAAAMGIRRFLMKPVAIAAMVETVNALVAGRGEDAPA